MIKRNKFSQEYQNLLWLSLLSTSQGTPPIIVHRLLVFKVKMLSPSCVDPLGALLRSCFGGDVPYAKSYLKPFYQLKPDLVDLPLSCVPIIHVSRTAGT